MRKNKNTKYQSPKPVTKARRKSTRVLQNELIRLVKKRIPGVVAIYQYGSSVSGNSHRGSDVDLAVLATKVLDPRLRFEIQGELAGLIHSSVDLLDLRAASAVMRIQVVAKGKLLFESNAQERVRFEMFVYSNYAKLNEERKAIITRVIQEGKVYA